MRTLFSIFFTPPMAIARVGASPTPLDAIEVTASNYKAARRVADATTGVAYMGCSFTARVDIAGDDHARRPLLAFSRHTSGQQPLVSPQHPIPLGSVQWVRPRDECVEGF